jgi:hypothetical protein
MFPSKALGCCSMLINKSVHKSCIQSASGVLGKGSNYRFQVETASIAKEKRKVA